MRVFCYFNLHRKCFSLKAMDGPDKGRVVAHADAVHLKDVSFKVSAAGRNRVLRERRKNVHAGAVGTVERFLAHGAEMGRQWLSAKENFETAGRAVSYNPYKAGHFFEVDSGAAVLSASECMLHGKSALVLA